MSDKSSAKAKPRLGRGLSSLISIPEVPIQAEVPASAAPPATSVPTSASSTSQAVARDRTGVLDLALDQIAPNPHQPRQDFDPAAIAELAASIKSTGLIQPVVVRPVGGSYQLIAGERRFRAARQAGLKTIPALVREVDAVTQAQMALIENIQRQDLNPIERAQGYRTLLEQLGLTQSELAGRLGEDRSSIANFLRLLELAEPVRLMVRDGRLSVGHAKLIAGVGDILEQERLAKLVLEQGLSVRNLERVMAEGPKPPAPVPAPTAGVAAHIQDLEKSLSRQLGLRVQVRSGAKKGKGRLVIHYATLDQFDELMGRLGVRAE